MPSTVAGKAARNPFFRYVPVASAAVITCAGLLMTGVALGVIRPFAGVCASLKWSYSPNLTI